MENTRTTQHGEGPEHWPALPYEAWRETCQTLHLWTQIVGKVRMALSPFLNYLSRTAWTGGRLDSPGGGLLRSRARTIAPAL